MWQAGPLLTPEAARAQASLDREADAERRKQQEEQAALLSEVSAFMCNHPDVTIVPPWDVLGGGELWLVEVAGQTVAYDNPEFMLSLLAERFGFTDD
jgi:hypothetical protein